MSDLLTLSNLTSLALADAVNPCAIAVLAMILISILTEFPENKKKVLYAGFAFCLAVIVGYLIYGTIIIQFFSFFAEFTRQNSVYLYKGLAIFSMILGALQVKDYFMYEPGGITTEMPLRIRPYVKLLIDEITSVKGAFVIGLLVTIFLLPCTIGPYIVASGILAKIGMIKAIPWLIYYNIVFVLPMIIITLMIYFGYSKVEDVSGWKERNIKRLHLISGVLTFAVGVMILFNWI